MITINFSPEERAAGRPNAESIAKMKRVIDEEGLVVLEDVVDLDHIRILRDKMLEDLPAVLARTDTPFNFTRSNVQQDPPPFHPYLFKDVLLNEYAIAATQSVLGPGLQSAFYSANVALPNTNQRQPVHADIGHLWANMPVATPAYALVINIPLVDMSAANGSTEVWPGSHLDTSIAMQVGDVKVSPSQMEAQARISPPIQPVVKAGSILIRDIRMWHAGMPNPSDQARPMIAMIHWVGWWNHAGKMDFPLDTKEFFDHPVLYTNANFVDGPINYLGRNEAYDLEPSSSS